MLTAQDLTCVRADRLLFKSVNVELAQGGLLYVLGENGSGKSSLLRLLGGLATPESGSVFWCGKPIKEDAETYHANVSYVGHLNGLKDDLTALENVSINARLASHDGDEQKALDALTAIGIERCAHLPVRVLSQGQKRRVALAKLWLTKASLWILDEPFSALDAASIPVLASRLSAHLSQGGMAIITTHQDVIINAQRTQTVRLSA
jgi:heme exporter protein A